VGVAEMKCSVHKSTKQAKMTAERPDHLLFVCHPREKPTVKTWKRLEDDWEFWLVFAEWYLG
jgi:hypothetical protein